MRTTIFISLPHQPNWYSDGKPEFSAAVGFDSLTDEGPLKRKMQQIVTSNVPHFRRWVVQLHAVVWIEQGSNKARHLSGLNSTVNRVALGWWGSQSALAIYYVAVHCSKIRRNPPSPRVRYFKTYSYVGQCSKNTIIGSCMCISRSLDSEAKPRSQAASGCFVARRVDELVHLEGSHFWIRPVLSSKLSPLAPNRGLVYTIQRTYSEAAVLYRYNIIFGHSRLF